MPGHGEMEHVRLVFIHGLVIVVRIEHRHVLFPGFVAIYPVTKDIYLIKTLLAVVGIPEHGDGKVSAGTGAAVPFVAVIVQLQVGPGVVHDSVHVPGDASPYVTIPSEPHRPRGNIRTIPAKAVIKRNR